MIKKKGTHFFYGYIVVFGGWLALFVSAGAQFSYGVFQPSLIETFGWSRGTLSLGMTLSLITMPIFGTLAGFLLDQIGPRWTVVMGAVIGSCGMLLLATINQAWHFIMLYGILVPLGIALCFMIPVISTVRRWFMRRAALMVSIAMTGASLGVVFLTNAAHGFIKAWGFRGGYLGLGIILILGGVIGGFLLKKDPESEDTYPDGIKPSGEELNRRVDFMTRAERWSAWEAFKTPCWWLLVLAQLGYLVTIFGMLSHMITWGAHDLGIPLSNMVIIFSYVFILSSVVGRVVGGYASDWHMARFEWSRKPVIYFCILGVTLGVFLCPFVKGASGMILVSIILGFTYGTGIAVFPTYLGDLFGLVNMPVLFGIQGLFTAGFSSIGPLLYGLIYDKTGSYNPAFVMTGIVCLISTICLAILRPPRKRTSEAPA